jgi:hypothetical protein
MLAHVLLVHRWGPLSLAFVAVKPKREDVLIRIIRTVGVVLKYAERPCLVASTSAKGLATKDFAVRARSGSMLGAAAVRFRKLSYAVIEKMRRRVEKLTWQRVAR